jgi:hypothetical protein
VAQAPWTVVAGYLVFSFLVASLHSFTAMLGSFTKSVVHPHSRHWTL